MKKSEGTMNTAYYTLPESFVQALEELMVEEDMQHITSFTYDAELHVATGSINLQGTTTGRISSKPQSSESRVGSLPSWSESTIYFFGNDENVNPKSIKDLFSDAALPFPKFEALPNETRSQTELRWEAERLALKKKQHDYVLTQFGLAYARALASCKRELADVPTMLAIRELMITSLYSTELTTARIRYDVHCDLSCNYSKNLANGCIIAGISYALAHSDTWYTCFVANKEEQWKF